MMTKGKTVIRLRKFSLFCLFLSIPCSLFGGVISVNFLVFAGTFLLITFIATSLLFWKCPYCKEPLPIRFNVDDDIKGGTHRCPFCKKTF